MTQTNVTQQQQAQPGQEVDAADVIQALQGRIGQMAMEHAIAQATIMRLSREVMDNEQATRLAAGTAEARAAQAETRAAQAEAELRSLKAVVAAKEKEQRPQEA